MSFLRQLAHEDALSETVFYLVMTAIILGILLVHRWQFNEFFEHLYKMEAASLERHLERKHTSWAKCNEP